MAGVPANGKLVLRCWCNQCGHRRDLSPDLLPAAGSGRKVRLRCSVCKSYDVGSRQCWMTPNELLPSNVVEFRKKTE
jgi:hypothetical protein